LDSVKPLDCLDYLRPESLNTPNNNNQHASLSRTQEGVLHQDEGALV